VGTTDQDMREPNTFNQKHIQSKRKHTSKKINLPQYSNQHIDKNLYRN